MNEVYAKTLSYWKSVGAKVAPVYERSAIENRLRAAGLEVGADFIDFYATVGGLEDWDMDPNQWSCWDLDRIIEWNMDSDEKVYFADWLIDSYRHFVRRESDERSSVWVDFGEPHAPKMVSPSLVDFFERYLAQDEGIEIYFETGTPPIIKPLFSRIAGWLFKK